MMNSTHAFFATKSKLNIKGLLALFALLLTMQSGWAQALLTEDFSYTTPGDITTASGGNWTAFSGSTFYPQYTNSGLTYSGYVGSGIGGAVTTATTGVADVLRTFTNQTAAGSVYAAFLVNVSSATTTGDYFVDLGNTAGSAFGAKFFVKKDVSNNLLFGLSKGAAVASATFTGATYALNTTYLVVFKYTIISGATNDTVLMYINPATTGTEPGSATITAADPTFADLAGVGSFIIRQGTPPGATIDGIRVGTTWASVVPSVGPSITGAATAATFTTTYGTASSPQAFTVSGSNLTANLIATAPTGFEVANGAGSYGTTATFTQSSGSASGTLNIRLAATAAVSGSYNSQTIVLSSTNATSVNITTASTGNTVSKASSSITASGTTSFVYNGSAQGPASTSSVTGSAGAVTYAYSGVSPTVYSSSATAPTVVGTYQVIATVAADANYNTASSTAYAFAITKASSSITATGTTSFAYTGSAQGPASNTKSGSTGAVTYAYSGVSPTVYSSSATAPTVVGTYQVIATVAADANYNTASSTALPFSITATAPGVPTSVSAVGGDASATITFTAPAFNGGSAITTYTATSSPAGGTGSVSQAGSGTISVTGLTNGTAYTFTVTATNGASLTSSASGVSNSVTPSAGSTIPYAPTAVVITPTDGGLSVAFTAGNNGGSTITDYEYSTDNGSSFKLAGVVVSPVVISGLTNLSTYQVQIRAVNINGSGTATSSVSGTPGLVPDAPAINSIAVGNTQLSVNFTAPTYTGGSAITTYQYSTDNGAHYITRQTGTTASPIVITTSSVDGTTALANGTTYTVLIKAVNGTGASVASGSATGTPATTPGAPSISSITAGDASLTVNFSAGTTGGSALTTYKYSTDGGATFATRAAGTTASPIIISTLSLNGATLTNGTSYNVQIKAVNAQGDGTATGTTAATPGTAPGAPTITGITVGNGQLSVAFTAGTTGGYAISNYQYSTNGGSSYTAVSPSQTISPIVITGLTNGTAYTVLIKAVNSIGAGTASNSLSGTPALTNDLCSGAIALTPGAAATAGTLVGATQTSTATFSSENAYTDVWYSFTPTCTGSHTITVNITSVTPTPDVDFVVFSGSCPTGTNPTEFLTALVTNATTETNSATFTAGTTYYIRVLDFNATSPTFTISVTGPTPVTQAVTAQAASSVTGTTATLNGNLTAVGVCPATTEKGFVYAVTTTNGDPLVSGTGVTKTTVATIATGAYTLALTGLTAGTGYTFKSYVYNGSTYTYGTATTFTTLATAPSVTAAVGATVDAAFSMTFTDNPTWRAAITGITVGGTALSASAYSTTSAGVITFTPSASTLLQSSGSKTIAISATNYNSVSVTQAIAAGVPSALTMTTQPIAPASSGAVLATMPVVTVKDQYANVISGSVVTAAVTSGQGSSWTLGGASQTATTNASGVATFTTLTATNTTSPSAPYSTASLTFTPGTGAGSVTSSTFTVKGIAPTITAASGATVDAAFDATFTDNATWRAAITGITVGGTSLTAGYSTATAGKITFTPSASNTATLLQSSGSKTIIVTATGYPTATFTQAIGVGAATKLAITTQPAAPASNGAALGTQPIIVIQDQYGNTTASTATVVAAVGAGSWTIGGTTSLGGVSGTATFTDLTATSVALVSGASITFSSGSLTPVTSGTFSIAAPIVDYVNITALGTAATENFDTALSTSATATLPNGFLVSTATGSPATAAWVDATNNISATTVVGGTSSTNVLSTNSSGGTYNYANGVAASASDRALGFLTSKNYPVTSASAGNVGLSILSKVKNTTGSTLSALTVAFDYEKYRNGQNACNWTFYYSTNGTSWTAVTGGNQTFAADADNALTTSAPVTTSKSTTITGLSLASGSYIYLRWSYDSGGTNAQGIGLDNFSVTGKAASTITVTGTTSFTYNGSAQGPNTVSETGSTGAVTYSYAGVSGTTYGPIATAPTNVGSYTATATVAADANYLTATSSPLSFTIGVATPTVTVVPGTYTYTTSAQGPAASVTSNTGTGSSYTFSYAGVSGTTYGPIATAPTAAGSYTVTATVAANGNYASASSTATGFTISKATPTATLAVSNSPATYTTSGQSATVSISASSVLGTVSSILTGGSATQTAAGTYAVTASFVPNDTSNYNTVTVLSAGNFVIGKATPTATLTVSNSPATYTGSTQSATVSIFTSSVLGTVSSIVTGGSATQTAVGTYAVTASFVPDDTTNYNTLTGVSAGNFVINKASSTVTVTGSTSFTYNAAPQGPSTSDKTGSSGSVTYSYVGVSGTSYTASATPPTNAGSYEVTATLAADTNYNGATSSAVGFTIAKLTPTVTVTPIGTYTYNGLAQGPTASNTGGSAGSVTYSYEGASYSASATRPTNAGSYTVTASVAATTNFAAASSDATSFTIDKAVVTVTGDDKTKTYGDSNPSFTASYDGFVHSETLATSGITGTPSLSTLADASSTVGTYTISAGAGDLAASNYSFSYKDGTLTVGTKGLTITAANQSKCFGSSLSLGTTAFTTSAMVSGDSVSSVSLSSTGTAVDASTGTYAITGSSASGTGLSNYAISYTDGTLTVNALPTATIGGNLTMCQNGTSPVVTFTGANGTAPYTFSYTINGGSTLTVSTTSGNSVTVSVPTTTAGSFVYSLVSVQDSSTTACSQTQTGTATVTFNTSSIYYADADGDGYGNLKVTSAPLCAAPAGYVANSTDCDDTNAAINPGQSEVSGDGIDNNCDGRVDEAGVTTKVVSSVCGTTLGALNSPIYVNLVSSPVVGYRYEVSYGSPATVRVYETTANNIILSNVVSPVYNTAYSIRVSVKTTQSNGDYWQAYGASCTVTTPAPPTTKLIPSLCGATLTSLYTNIYCGAVPLVTSYKFSVTDASNVERIKITTSPVFTLMQFPSAPSYGTYSIKVAVLYNGVWQDYGTPCSLTTVMPTTQLVSSVCGATLTSLYAPLYANAVNQVTSYQFEVSTGGSVVGTYTASSNVFNLMQLSSGILYSTTYSIRVAPIYNGTTQAYGTACSVTTPAIVTTQLVASVCGTSLTSLYAPLYANAIPLATGYRFEVKNGANLVGTYDASSNVFNLMQVAGVTSSTTYSVRVAVIYNGTVQGYGSTCTVTTPILGVTKLVSSVCGANLGSLYAPLYCYAVTFATGYEFEVSDGATTRTYDATSNQFNLMQLSGGAEYSTTYTVRVAPIISGVVQAFGASCTVTTLAIPTTTVVASRCGTTLTSLYAPIYANGVTLATGYSFKVIDNATGLQVGSTYSSSSNVFNLKQVSGTDKGKSYSISVAVQYNGLYQGFGTPCTVNTAANAAVRMSDETLASVFTVKAYPNPFASSFNLAIESESDEVISVQVYDMIGRELEARKATVSELSTQELGNNYPSGVYNIIVSQGDQVKTLRMIKR